MLKLNLEKKLKACIVKKRQILDLIQEIKLKQNIADSEQWKPEKNGAYSIKSCNNFIDRIDYPSIFLHFHLIYYRKK